MIRFGQIPIVIGFALSAGIYPAASQEKTFLFEEIDKNKTISELYAVEKDPCPIVFKDGKAYKACPNFKIDGLDAAIAKFKAQ